jgi:hypothetical protein
MTAQNTEWTLWRSAVEPGATLAAVKELMAEGRHVRVVHEGDHNDIYSDGPVEAVRS